MPSAAMVFSSHSCRASDGLRDVVELAFDAGKIPQLIVCDPAVDGDLDEALTLLGDVVEEGEYLEHDLRKRLWLDVVSVACADGADLGAVVIAELRLL